MRCSAGGRQARRPASSNVQPIPEAKPGAQQQRMTRAQASRAAQEMLQQVEAARNAGPDPMDTDGSERGLEGPYPSNATPDDNGMFLLQVSCPSAVRCSPQTLGALITSDIPALGSQRRCSLASPCCACWHVQTLCL